MKHDPRKNIFRIVLDGELFRWQREQFDTRWTSRDAWTSDIEAASAAVRVATCYDNSEVHVHPALVQSLDVWNTVQRHAIA